MGNHEAVAKIDEERLDQDCGHEVRIVDCNVEFTEEFVLKLSDFESMRDAHLGRLNN